jgi:hypothetical protein
MVDFSPQAEEVEMMILVLGDRPVGVEVEG